MGRYLLARTLRTVLEKLKKMPYPSDANLVAEVGTKKIIRFEKNGAKKVALIDCGVKSNIVNELKKRFSVVQVPWDTPAKFFYDEEIDGVFLSNGPGVILRIQRCNKYYQYAQTLKGRFPHHGDLPWKSITGIGFRGKDI